MKANKVLCLAIVVAAFLWPAAPSSSAAVPPEDLERIGAAAPPEAPAKPLKARRLLVFTLAKGYIHSATPWGAEALRILGEKTGAFSTVVSQDPSVFEKESLDAV